MNPFSDILQQNDQDSKETLNRVGSLIKELGIDTTISPPRSDISSSYLVNKQFFADFDDPQVEVDDLVKRLKGLVGEFDASSIYSKLSESQASHAHSSYSYGLSPEPPEPTPIPNNTSVNRGSIRSPPLNIPQGKPFRGGGLSGLNTPRTVSSQGRRDSVRFSQALKSTRYSMGLNMGFFDRPTPAGLFSPSNPSMVFSNQPSPTFVSQPQPQPSSPYKLPSTVPAAPLFDQFCIFDIDPAYIGCHLPLPPSPFLPPTCTYSYPPSTPLLVDNLHEYLFPHGVKIALIGKKVFKRRKNSFAPICYLLQFTDSSYKIYYAYCVCVHYQVQTNNPHLIHQLESINTLCLASDVIKKYLRAYIYRKKNLTKSYIHMQWAENIKSRGNSIDPSQLPEGLGQGRRGVNTWTAGGTGSSSGGLKSFLAGLKAQVMRKKPKDPMAKLKKSKDTLKDPAKDSTWKTGLFHSQKKKSRTLSMSSDSSALDEGTTGSRSGEGGNLAAKISLLSLSPSPSPRSGLPLHPESPTAADSRRGRAASVGASSSPMAQVPTPRSIMSVSSSEDEGAGVEARRVFRAGSSRAERKRHFFPSGAGSGGATGSSRRGVIMGQKAYCILSERANPALFFQILTALANKENKRPVSSSSSTLTLPSAAATPTIKPYPSPPPTTKAGAQAGAGGIALVSPAASFSSPMSSVQSLLGLQNSYRNDYLSFLKNYSIDKFEAAWKKGTVNLSYPSYMDNLIVTKTQASIDMWAVAVLTYFIPTDVIVHIQLMLLLEKSLIILGSDAALVSLLCTAFLHLLTPYKWTGIFVPLLPPLAQEVLEAPVPFIVGMYTPELFSREATQRPKALTAQHTANILYVDDFVKYGKLYKPMPTDLQEFRTSITEVEHLLEQEEFLDAPSLRHFEPCVDKQVNIMVDILCKDLTLKMAYQHKRFMHRMGQIYSKYSLNSLQHSGSASHVNQLIQDLLFDNDDQLYRPISKILQYARDFNTEYTAGLLDSSHAWQHVGNLNASSGYLEIEVEKVMQPLRMKVLFQEQFLCTQMFTTFADIKHAHYQDLARHRQFISDWVKFRLKIKRKQKRRLQTKSCVL